METIETIWRGGPKQRMASTSEVAMLDQIQFDDGRGAFPDKIAVSVPRGFREVARAAAAKTGVSVAEFARRALTREISEVASRDESGAPPTLDPSVNGKY